MFRSVILLLSVVAIPACKMKTPAASTTNQASVACSEMELYRLENELARVEKLSVSSVNPSQKPASQPQPAAVDKDSILREFTIEYRLPQADILEVFESSYASPMWSAKVVTACAPYAKAKAEAGCKHDRTCRNLWGAIDANSDSYKLYEQRAQNFCESQLRNAAITSQSTWVGPTENTQEIIAKLKARIAACKQ